MLYLIQRNRLGKNIINKGEDTFNWHDAFKPSEDSLTSSIFSLLFYLPVELFWDILFNSCFYQSMPKECGKLLSYEFWPHWNCKDTENSSYVEPDLFLDFENFHLIVEAKRYDYIQQQNESQWTAEIIAYRNEFSESQRKPLYFIALAGILNGAEKQDVVLSVSITTCRWARILSEVKKKISKHLNYNNTQLSDSTLNILNDLVKSFALHGFRTGELLESIPNIYTIKEARNLFLTLNFIKYNDLKLIEFPTFLKNIGYSSKHISL